MHYNQFTVLPLSFCYQAYAVLFLVGCAGIMSTFSLAIVTIYGMGGLELVLAMSFVMFFGFLRLLFPPWSSSLDDNASYFTCQRRPSRTLDELAVDTFNLQPTEELISSCAKCPICLEEYRVEDEVSTTRTLSHRQLLHSLAVILYP